MSCATSISTSPSPLQTDRQGEARVVTDTVQAAEVLIENWPEERRGPKYRAALEGLHGRDGAAQGRRFRPQSLHRRRARGTSFGAKRRQRQQALALHVFSRGVVVAASREHEIAGGQSASRTSWSTSLSLWSRAMTTSSPR